MNALNGTIDVLADVTGSIQVSGDVHGAITIGTGAASPGNLTGTVDLDSNLMGTILVTGDVVGDIQIAGNLQDPGGLSGGHIIVQESFVDEADIIVGGQLLGTTTYIAIDHDGFDLADSWQSGAQVWLAGVPYGGNTPDEHLWEVTCQKGDVRNDGVVDMFDIDPFVMILNGDLEGYHAAYPGLLGSVDFHADLNCDGNVDMFDLDPFVLRLTAPEDYCAEYYDPETCYDCDCAGGGKFAAEGGGGPGEVADLLREYVAEERLPFIIETAAELAVDYADTPRGAFWAAVLDELSP